MTIEYMLSVNNNLKTLSSLDNDLIRVQEAGTTIPSVCLVDMGMIQRQSFVYSTHKRMKSFWLITVQSFSASRKLIFSSGAVIATRYLNITV